MKTRSATYLGIATGMVIFDAAHHVAHHGSALDRVDLLATVVSVGAIFLIEQLWFQRRQH